MNLEFTISCRWCTGVDGDEEHISEDKTGTAEEIKEWIDGFVQSREREQARADAVMPEEEE